MNNKKSILIFTFLGALVIGSIGLIWFIQIEKNKPIEQEKPWATYTDEANHFQIDYPSTILTDKEENNETSSRNEFGILEPSGGVNFVPFKDGPGIMGVHIYKGTGFASAQDWLDYKTKLSFTTRQKHNPEESKNIDGYLPPFEIEKSIDIAGQEATVIYPVSRIDGEIYEAFEYEKQAIFAKDGIVYVIWTRYFKDERDYEYVWNSFKFIP